MRLDQRPTRVVVLVWLLLSALFALVKVEGEVTAFLVGPDDHTRLVRVADFLADGAWYDDVIDRIDPPTGAEMVWARVPDLPLAGTLLLAEQVLPADLARVVMATAVPLGLCLAFLLAVTWATSGLVGWAHAPVGALMAMTMPGILQFLPGRIDHHNWVMLAIALAFSGYTLGFARHPGRGVVLLTGACAGVGLYISIGALVGIAAIAAAFTLAWILGDDAAAPRFAGWMGGLSLAAIAALPLADPPGDVLTVACDRFSLPYVAASLAGLAYALGLWWAPGRLPAAGRLVLAAGLGGGLLAGLWLAFPACRAGPTAQIPADQWAIWLSDAAGLAPLWEKSPSTQVAYLFMPAIAAAGAIANVWRSPDSRPLWAGLAVALLLAIAATLATTRANSVTHALSAPVLGWLLWTTWQRIEASWRGRKRAGGLFASTLLFLFAPIAVPGAVGKLADAPAASDARCRAPDVRGIFTALEDQPPGLVLAPLFAGPYVLSGTPHAVLAAQYHTNVAGNRKAYAIWRAETSDGLRQKLASANVDYVIACQDRAKRSDTFDRMFQNGDAAWLRRIKGAPDSPYVVYRIEEVS